MEPILTFLLICCSSFIGPSMCVYEGELNYCPPTPNCVSSQSWNWNPIHSIKPYTYTKRQKKLPIRFQNSHIFGVWEYPIFYKTGNYFWRRVNNNFFIGVFSLQKIILIYNILQCTNFSLSSQLYNKIELFFCDRLNG